MAEILPEDSGIIRCICGYTHDDNFTIQCERCNAWQHAICVKIMDQDSVPEKYMCPECNGTSSHLSRDRARVLQKQVLSQQAEIARLAATIASGGVVTPEEGELYKRSRRRTETKLVEPAFDQPPEVFVYKNTNTPITENVWAPEAAKIWETAIAAIRAPNTPKSATAAAVSRLRTVSARELKNAAQVSIVRRPSGRKWQFGLSDSTVVADSNIGANKYVFEAVGEILDRREYARDRLNQFWRTGCPKRGVVFVPGLPLVLDSRRLGSEVVFLRRHSNPNVRLSVRRDSHNNMRVLVVTRRAVKAGEELTLGWHWDEDHPIRRDGSAESEAVRSILWLLDAEINECLVHEGKLDHEADEDWSIDWYQANELVIPPVPMRPAELTALELKERKLEENQKEDTWAEAKDEVKSEPEGSASDEQAAENAAGELPIGAKLEGYAPSSLVWDSAVLDPPPQPKKRMTLADYMRKKT